MSQNNPVASSRPEYKFTYRFSPKPTSSWAAGPIKLEIVTTDNDTSTSREEAINRLSDLTGYSDPESELTLKRTELAFNNAPWGDDWGKLEEFFLSIPSVRNFRYESPYEETYRPPRYQLSVKPGSEEQVSRAINEYYRGLHTRTVSSGSIETIVVPVYVW